MIKEEKMIQMVSVQSSFIKEIGYNYKTNELITILDGNQSTIYLYKDVPEEVYDGLINSESKGAYYSKEIRGVYESSKKNCDLISSCAFYYNCDTNEIIDNRKKDTIPSNNKQERVTEKLINRIGLLIKESKLTDDKINQLLEILGE